MSCLIKYVPCSEFAVCTPPRWVDCRLCATLPSGGGPGSPSKQTPTWDGAKQRGNKARSVSPLGVLCPGRGSRHGSRLLTPRDTPGDEGRACLMNIDPVYMHSILRFRSIFWLIGSVHAQQLREYSRWHVNQHIVNKPETQTTKRHDVRGHTLKGPIQGNERFIFHFWVVLRSVFGSSTSWFDDKPSSLSFINRRQERNNMASRGLRKMLQTHLYNSRKPGHESQAVVGIFIRTKVTREPERDQQMS